MSMSALCLATRNLLRAELTNFYGSNQSHRDANCRVMPDDKPASSAGQEFISIYGSAHRPRGTHHTIAIEEEMGLTIGVTLKAAKVPKQHRGEASYMIDSDEFAVTWKSVEARCREIVGLVDKNYQLMRNADALFDNAWGFTEPLAWLGTDPQPTECYADHFIAYHAAVDTLGMGGALPGQPEADDVYGLLMHVHFGQAIRLQETALYDRQLA